MPRHVGAHHESGEAAADQDPDDGVPELVHDRDRQPCRPPRGRHGHENEGDHDGEQGPPAGRGVGRRHDALADRVAQGLQTHADDGGTERWGGAGGAR